MFDLEKMMNPANLFVEAQKAQKQYFDSVEAALKSQRVAAEKGL